MTSVSSAVSGRACRVVSQVGRNNFDGSVTAEVRGRREGQPIQVGVDAGHAPRQDNGGATIAVDRGHRRSGRYRQRAVGRC